MFQIIRYAILTILITLSLTTFIFLFHQNYALSGKVIANYDFSKSNAFISKLKPAGRVLAVKLTNNDYWQPMIIDPVYFDLFLPTNLQTAYLTITYQKPDSQILKIGPQVAENWSYDLRELKCARQQNGWCVDTLTFNLTKTLHQDKMVNFIISSPGLDQTNQQIKITNIKVEMTK